MKKFILLFSILFFAIFITSCGDEIDQGSGLSGEQSGFYVSKKDYGENIPPEARKPIVCNSEVRTDNRIDLNYSQEGKSVVGESVFFSVGRLNYNTRVVDVRSSQYRVRKNISGDIDGKFVSKASGVLEYYYDFHVRDWVQKVISGDPQRGFSGPNGETQNCFGEKELLYKETYSTGNYDLLSGQKVSAYKKIIEIKNDIYHCERRDRKGNVLETKSFEDVTTIKEYIYSDKLPNLNNNCSQAMLYYKKTSRAEGNKFVLSEAKEVLKFSR